MSPCLPVNFQSFSQLDSRTRGEGRAAPFLWLNLFLSQLLPMRVGVCPTHTPVVPVFSVTVFGW